MESLPAWGAWIEILWMYANLGGWSRSPHGERGLKSTYNFEIKGKLLSRSPHGERGLKLGPAVVSGLLNSRSPHGERGLKFVCHSLCGQVIRRSPHGERGLK